jgi:hypothetical protein
MQDILGFSKNNYPFNYNQIFSQIYNILQIQLIKNVSSGKLLGTDCMNVISFGEKDVSCEARKLTSDKYQLFPLISKYNFGLSIFSPLKFVVNAVF